MPANALTQQLTTAYKVIIKLLKLQAFYIKVHDRQLGTGLALLS